MTALISFKKNDLSVGILMLSLSFACMALLRWGGEPLLPLCAALAIGLVLCMARAPQLGFAALPPLLLATSYPPAFNDPGTLFFMALSGVWIGTGIWQARASALPRYPSWLWKIVAFIGVVLAINFIAAIHHGISVSAWLRGLYPFLLLGLAVPFLLGKPPSDHWRFLALAVGITCVVLSAQILFIYCGNRLWEPLAITNDLVQRFFNSPQGEHSIALNGAYNNSTMKLRITLIFPEAASIMAPLGFVGWIFAAHGVPKFHRWVAIAAAALCLCAIIATATRSMVFCCGLSVGLTLLIYYWNSRKRFFESVAIGAIVLAVSSPFLLGTPALGDLWKRNQDLFKIHEHNPTEHNNTEHNNTAYQDIGYRLQEYQQAWAAFVDAPLTGQGFGHVIKLVFPRGSSDEEVTVAATYTHNWVLYWLMVAGIPGLLMYGLMTLAPLVRLRAFRDSPNLPLTLVLAGAGILMASYGLFFAVYRTLPNVLCLTMLLGWTLSSWGTARKHS